MQDQNNLNLSFGIIALGANLPSDKGNVAHSLHAALGIVHSEPHISITAVSRFWRTPAMPAGSGPDYINAAALFSSTLTPGAILARLHAIEARFGRDRSTGRWSARVLDLDLIACGAQILPDRAVLQHWMALPPDQQTCQTPDRLILPHPRLQDRGFVLGPLAEIAPGWRHPVTGRTVLQMLAALPAAAWDGMASETGAIHPFTGEIPNNT